MKSSSWRPSELRRGAARDELRNFLTPILRSNDVNVSIEEESVRRSFHLGRCTFRSYFWRSKSSTLSARLLSPRPRSPLSPRPELGVEVGEVR